MKRWGAVIGLLAACSLTACGGDEAADEPAVPTQTVTALDDSFTIEVPEGWTTQEKFLGAPVVVAMQSEAGVDQVRVSHYLDSVRAEEEAISASGILSGSNVFCERVDDTTVFGDERLVFDCPLETPGAAGPVRQLLFPIVREGEEESALVLIETTSTSLSDAADLARPVLESFTWE